MRGDLGVATIKKLPGAPSPEAARAICGFSLTYQFLISGKDELMQPPAGRSQDSPSPHPPVIVAPLLVGGGFQVNDKIHC